MLRVFSSLLLVAATLLPGSAAARPFTRAYSRLLIEDARAHQDCRTQRQSLAWAFLSRAERDIIEFGVPEPIDVASARLLEPETVASIPWTEQVPVVPPPAWLVSCLEAQPRDAPPLFPPVERGDLPSDSDLGGASPVPRGVRSQQRTPQRRPVHEAAPVAPSVTIELIPAEAATATRGHRLSLGVMAEIPFARRAPGLWLAVAGTHYGIQAAPLIEALVGEPVEPFHLDEWALRIDGGLGYRWQRAGHGFRLRGGLRVQTSGIDPRDGLVLLEQYELQPDTGVTGIGPVFAIEGIHGPPRGPVALHWSVELDALHQRHHARWSPALDFMPELEEIPLEDDRGTLTLGLDLALRPARRHSLLLGAAFGVETVLQDRVFPPATGPAIRINPRVAWRIDG